MNYFPFRLFMPLLLFAALSAAYAKTFVIPHVLEKSGTVANTQYTFDTTLYVTYNSTLSDGDVNSAQVELFLYEEDTGLPMRGSTGAVCNPCVYTLDAKTRKLSIPIDDLITSKGGGFDQEIKLGFAVIVVSGSGADAVNVQGFVVNSHTSAFDLSVFGFDPQPIRSPEARTLVIPHVLETSGRTAANEFSFDTILHAAYVGGLPGTSSDKGAELKLHLYDQTGAPMLSGTGTEVCNPCSYNLDSGSASGSPNRKETIVLGDLIDAAGGFGASSTRVGFAVVSVGGADPGNVGVQGFVVNSHTSPFDLSVFGFEPQPVAATAKTSSPRTFVLPHILEKEGKINNTQYTFDTTLYATYIPGLGGTPSGPGATLDLYLYDDSGAAMVGSKGTAVCAPCSFNLGPGTDGSSTRKLSIFIDDLMQAAGGFDALSKLGYGLVVVGGADPQGVSLENFVVNSHTSAFDLSVFGFEPQEVQSAPASKTFVLPHVLEKQGTVADTQFTFDTTLFATYSGGLPASGPSAGAALKLYLYDSATGLPLAGATGEVCNPCTFNLSADHRKETISVESLIQAKGGGFGMQPIKTASGLVVIEGDVPHMNLAAFIANSHTGPFDLSVFGFEPQPILAARVSPMPINISLSGGQLSLVVPTVIGGEYAVEAKNKLDGDWAPVETFFGDGSVRTVPLPASATTQQFYRVKGY